MRRHYRFIQIILSVWLAYNFLIIELPTQIAAAAAGLEQPEMFGQPILFKETGHTLAYNFRQFWEQKGGLAAFGYPLTEVFLEDGRPVQYFERSRLEWHADLDLVEAGLLGNMVAQDRLQEPAFMPVRLVAPEITNGSYFAQTGHTIQFGFLDYWLQKGGLAVFGYPISEEFSEVNHEDGQNYTVQYFERARFEYHSELSVDSRVLLGQLGRVYLEQNKNAPAWAITRVETASLAWQSLRPNRIRLARLGLDTEVVEGAFNLQGWDVPRYTAVHYWPVAAFPGSAGNIILAGHAGYKNTIFDQLPQAIIGDDITVWVGQSQRHYRVKNIKIVQPTDNSVLYPTAQETLTLITCVPPGLLTSRLIVQAFPVET